MCLSLERLQQEGGMATQGSWGCCWFLWPSSLALPLLAPPWTSLQASNLPFPQDTLSCFDVMGQTSGWSYATWTHPLGNSSVSRVTQGRNKTIKNKQQQQQRKVNINTNCSSLGEEVDSILLLGSPDPRATLVWLLLGLILRCCLDSVWTPVCLNIFT